MAMTTLERMVSTTDEVDELIDEARKAMAEGAFGRARTALVQALDVLDGPLPPLDAALRAA